MAEVAWKVVGANRLGRIELTATKKDLQSGEAIGVARDERHRLRGERVQQNIAEMRESAVVLPTCPITAGLTGLESPGWRLFAVSCLRSAFYRQSLVPR